MSVIYEAKVSYKKIGEVPSATMDGTRAAVDYMRGAFRSFPFQEQLWVMCLDIKNKVRSREMVGLGVSNSCLVEPSSVFRCAILQGASAIIVVHNHPSGDPDPSSADLKTCGDLQKAGKWLDIEVKDFIVIGHNKHWSANENGLL